MARLAAVNMRGFGRYLVVTVALLVLCGVALPRVSADDPAATNGDAQKNGITITPTQKELVVSSGLINATSQVDLTNNTGHDLEANIRVVDFKTLNETGGLLFNQVGVPTEKYGLASYVTLPNSNKITLTNGKTTVVPIVITNRFDLAPGGHYAAVVVTVSTAGTVSSNRASFKQELVSLLLVKKLGGEDYGLQLQSFTTNTKTGIPSSATLRFRGAGNVHVVPRGYITVTDPKGKLVAKGLINQESALILPGSTRLLTSPIMPVAQAKLPGRYKVTAYYRHDEQTKFDSKTIYVYRIPPLLFIAPVVLLAAIVAVVVWRVRHRRPKFRHR